LKQYSYFYNVRGIYIFIFVIASLSSFGQLPCKCPEYKGGVSAFNKLIENSLSARGRLDSFQLTLTFDSIEGYWNTLKVDTNSYPFIKESLPSELEKGLYNWDLSKVYEDNGNMEKIVRLFYQYPSKKSLCLIEEIACVLISEYTESDSLEDDDEVDPEDDVFELFDVSEMAKFRNGHKDLVAFLDSSVIWPSTMGMICGNWTVNVIFVVETDGTISSVETLGSKKGFGLDEEAIRVIKLSSGLWTPAQQGDNMVRMRMRVPVRFRH